jgi:hypothetical protein
MDFIDFMVSLPKAGLTLNLSLGSCVLARGAADADHLQDFL